MTTFVQVLSPAWSAEQDLKQGAINTGFIAGPQGNPPPPVDSRYATELGALIANAGTTPGALSQLLDLDPLFLVRVIAKRQPLPVDVARLLAIPLKVDAGTVMGAAGFVTTETGPIFRVPVPPDPLLGDLIAGEALGVTQPVVAPPTQTAIGCWVCGPGLGGGGLAGVVVIDKSFGVASTVPLLHTGAPNDLAFGPGGLVVALGGSNGYGGGVTVPGVPTLAAEPNDGNNAGVVDVAFEPSTGQLFGGQPAGLLVVTSLQPLVSSTMAIAIAGSSANVMGLCATAGKIYACASAAPAGKRGLVEVEPIGKTITRTTTAAGAMSAPNSVAFGTGFWLVTDVGILWTVDPATFTAVGLANDAAPNAATHVSFIDGEFWISDTGTLGKPRIFRLRLTSATTSVLVADYNLGINNGGCGRVAKDLDGSIWCALPADSSVHILDPRIVSGDPTTQTFNLIGQPLGLAIL